MALENPYRPKVNVHEAFFFLEYSLAKTFPKKQTTR